MKKIKLLVVAFVAMFGFIACDKHECNDYDHSKDLVGTWTCLQDGFAEALVIKTDGSALSTGYDGEEYWEDVAGNIVVKNGMVTLTFEDGDNFDGHFDIIPGVAFSIYTDEGNRFTFNYCKEDLSDEIVGMWVCNDGPASGNKMTIQTFKENGKAIFTGFGSYADVNLVNDETSYKVIGDLLFYSLPKDKLIEGASPYITLKLSYSPNGTAYGDIMGQIAKKENEGEVTSSWLRIKQHLELPGMKYDYIKTFVSNVKGVDMDIDVMGYKFNFAKMDGVMLDKMLKTLLFTVEFPDANTIKYSCLYDRNAEPAVVEAPIAVDGNKMTIKISEEYPGLKDVDMYTFQDQDNTQMHMYMPTYSFINFFGNMQVIMMSQLDMIDTTDAAAVKAIYDSIDEAVETINVSFVMTKATKAL